MTSSPLHNSVDRAVRKLFRGLGSPLSLRALEHYDKGEWDDLASMKVDPRGYTCSEAYWRDATATSLLRKMKELPTSFDRKAVAEQGFLDCEKKCFSTNLRLLPYLSPGLPGTDEGVLGFISRARKIAAKLLGPAPTSVEGRFGPGSTFADRGHLTTVPDKMSSAPTITHLASPLLFEWGGTAWRRAMSVRGYHEVVFVEGNRFTTVPKDCTKDRGIAVEPSINLFYQLGYGRLLRERLKHFGINLVQGKEIHMQVACRASLTGAHSTLDLSSASDTVCRNLVKLLLPPDWFERLDSLRSPKTSFKGRWHLLEKFSSMGNGFTFELETLIFLCLILAIDPSLTAGENVWVFGDDIIVPTGFSKAVIAVLEFFGMSLNKSKSFVDGPFRESCGGDYFWGVDVRPHFLEEAPSEPQQLISLANGLRRAGKGFEDRWACILPAWHSVLDAIPTGIRRHRGPEALGDLVVHDNEKSWRYRWRDSIRYISVWRPLRQYIVGWDHFKSDVILASALYGTGDGISDVFSKKPFFEDAPEVRDSGGVIPRDSITSYADGWVAWS